MIGYDDVTIVDFNNYFSGCFIFHVSPLTHRVSSYNLGSVEVEDSLYADEPAREYEALIRNEERGTDRVSIQELFDLPEWIIYRIPLGYVVGPDKRLLRLSSSVDGRRMLKGNTISNMCTLPAVRETINHVPPNIREGLVSPTPLSTYTANQYKLWTSVADTLALGNYRCTRGTIPLTEARRLTRLEIIQLLVGDKGNDHHAVALSPSMAVIKHRGKQRVGYLLMSGEVIGKVKLELADKIVVLANPQVYSSRTARASATKGLRSLTTRVFADEFRWAF